MKRREFARKSLLGIAYFPGLAADIRSGIAAAFNRACAVCFPGGKGPAELPAGEPFPTNLPGLEWKEFSAAGFSRSVSGVIFRTGSPSCCGVPLGGVSTGCLDIEATGSLGFNNVFDAFPRKPQLLCPFLGLAVGDHVWVLTTERLRAGGVFETCHEPYTPVGPWMASLPEISGVRSVKEIHSWGHFPVADLEFETDAPVGVGLRAWAPFLPGDAVASNTPGAVFEVHLRNTTNLPQKGTLAFNFPGPTQQEAQVPAKVPNARMQIGSREALRPAVPGGVKCRLERIRTPVNGVSLVVETGVGYCLGVIGDVSVRVGRGLEPEDWRKIKSSLPAMPGGEFGGFPATDSTLPVTTTLAAARRDFAASVAADFTLGPNETQTVRFVLAWYAPEWCGEGEKKYTQMYTTRFKSAVEVAQLLARDHASLLRRILAWQEAIYTAHELPPWLRDTLINNLMNIAEDSYWAVAQAPILDWAPPEGVFGMIESPRGSPQIECNPCSWYGNIPIVYFFPNLARSTLYGYLHYMRSDGAAVFRWGPGSDMANPTWEWQKSLNGPCFVDMVGRLWLRTGDDSLLRQFYPAVKKNTAFTMRLRSGPEGIISMPEGNVGREWWETINWYGMAAHVGGMHLSNLKIAERMAEKVGDAEFAQQCREWYRRGSAAMEEKMWTGEYYLMYNDPPTGKKSDTIMANQIDGDWANAFHGLPNIFRADRLQKALATFKRTCLNDVCGAVSFADADGTPQVTQANPESGQGIYVAEVMILGMMYLYAADPETGLEIVRRLMSGLVCRNFHGFDLPNAIRCDTGQRTFGTDYYQAMMLWAMPAAIARKDLRGPSSPGGLVDRIIEAAKLG